MTYKKAKKIVEGSRGRVYHLLEEVRLLPFDQIITQHDVGLTHSDSDDASFYDEEYELTRYEIEGLLGDPLFVVLAELDSDNDTIMYELASIDEDGDLDIIDHNDYWLGCMFDPKFYGKGAQNFQLKKPLKKGLKKKFRTTTKFSKENV